MLPLPIEIVVYILAFVPLDTVARLQLVSRSWRELIKTNEQTIWHQTALLHGFVPSGTTASSDLSALYSKRSLAGVDNWKSLCMRRLQISRSWSGRGPSSVVHHTTATSVAHRFKVDEAAGYLVCTTTNGYLMVSDLEDERMIWSLPANYVRPFAHCEYGEGYLIFDRIGGDKEVWRRAGEYETSPVPSVSVPDLHQRHAYQEACDLWDPASGNREHFRPWLLISPPSETRAYRFVYPTLLSAGWNRAYLWDIRSGRLEQTIQNIQNGGDDEALGDITYVELSDRHVFICGTEMLRVFSRDTGRSVLDISSTQATYGNWQFKLRPATLPHGVTQSVLVSHDVERSWDAEEHSSRIIDTFIAVHVSKCGSHFVALLQSSRLVVVYNFERVIRGEESLRSITLDIQLGSPRSLSFYLAFENGRVGVATKSGLFVLEPLILRDTTPSIRVARVFALHSSSYVSCLHMTDTGLFVNWTHKNRTINDQRDQTEFNRSLLDTDAYQVLENGDRLPNITVPQFRPLQSNLYEINFVRPQTPE